MMKMENKTQTSEVKEAVVRGHDVGISAKHAIAICKFLKGRKIDYSISFLEDVIKMKKAMPMRGEIPHRHGIAGGRYPVKASKVFIGLLKNLKANASSKNLDVSKLVIAAKADRASRARKPGKYARKFKRTHLEIKGILKQ